MVRLMTLDVHSSASSGSARRRLWACAKSQTAASTWIRPTSPESRHGNPNPKRPSQPRSPQQKGIFLNHSCVPLPAQVVVTGGNTGLGKQTCIRLASMGADVVLASRSAKRGEVAAQEVRDATGSDKVKSAVLDLASLKSIEEFAAAFSEVRSQCPFHRLSFERHAPSAAGKLPAASLIPLRA